MTGPVDGLVWLQWAGIIIPTLAVGSLFVRLGEFLSTVKAVKDDIYAMRVTMDELRETANMLTAWRDASRDSNSDLLERVRRLEDHGLSHKP